MSALPQRGGWRERAPSRMRDGPRGRRGRRGPHRRIGEGGCPPPRPVALDREAPTGDARSKVGAETTAQPEWILAPRLPEPEDTTPDDYSPCEGT